MNLKYVKMELSSNLIHDIEKDSKDQSYLQYVQRLKAVCIANYEVRVKNHNRKFTSVNRPEHLLTVDIPELKCSDEFKPEAIKTAIIRTQEGLTDYPAFLKEIAAAGVHNYLADLGAMKILYMGAKAADLYIEIISGEKD